MYQILKTVTNFLVYKFKNKKYRFNDKTLAFNYQSCIVEKLLTKGHIGMYFKL